MTLKHLNIFATVYKTLNITRASEQLHMTQPAVSRAIQEIEHYYGRTLFDRMNHRLYHTEAGDELYSYAIHILESFHHMEYAMKNQDPFGVLRIGSTMTVGNFLIPVINSHFQKKYPRLTLRTTVANGSYIQQALLDNMLDFAVMEDQVRSEYLMSEFLMTDNLCVISAPQHPLCRQKEIRLADLIQYPLLLRENGSTARDLCNHIFALHELPLDPLWESTSTQALVKAVSLGIGISILPQKIVTQDLCNETICKHTIVDEPFARQWHIVRHKQKVLSPLVNEYIALCKKYTLA